MAATVTVRWIEGGELRSGDIGDLPEARKSGHDVWVDVLRPDAEAFGAIAKAFELRDLALDDGLNSPKRVKVRIYPDVLFLVWLLPYRTNGSLIRTTELDVHLGEDFLLTSHDAEVGIIDEVAADAARGLPRGAEWVLHALLDRGVDDLFPVIDGMAEALDKLEDALLGEPAQADLERLYKVKRALVSGYRIVAAERDAIRSMARREALVSQDAYLYFQDVGDHLARAADSIDTYRDVASSAMDIYLSAVNNRMNAIMKQLTVVATIFMPLTLISGIYGMNLLRGMWPPPTASWSFAAVIGSMVAISIGMLWFFRKRSWW